ncbi:MAG: hypothetical protein WDA74_07360 [Spirochaetota bacterium]
MSSLKDMIAFLNDTTETLESISNKLEKIQSLFNKNFNNVIKVRTDEIEFLQEEFFKNKSNFPVEVDNLFKDAINPQSKIFNEKLLKLKSEKNEMEQNLEKINSSRIAFMKKLKKSNVTLDTKEESLKEKINLLEDEIDAYNKKIDEMNTGFGFIINFSSMKQTDKLKKELLEKRDAYIDQIENTRNRWIESEKDIGEKDLQIQEKWNYLQAEYSILVEKILNLEENQEELIKKGAFTKAIGSLSGYEKYLALNEKKEKPEKCPLCKSQNLKNIFFCDFCGAPFSDNRPDIEGSLIETGELNNIFLSLQEGIKQSVSLIALIRGLKQGLNKFLQSIKGVKATEDRYSQLPTLRINIPEFSKGFAEKLKNMDKSIEIKLQNVHPLKFAEEIKKNTSFILNEPDIEKFFQLMGNELNKSTKEQW